MTKAKRDIKRKLTGFQTLRGVKRRFSDLSTFRDCSAVFLHMEEALSAIRRGGIDQSQALSGEPDSAGSSGD
jgi:hypothetical protein